MAHNGGLENGGWRLEGGVSGPLAFCQVPTLAGKPRGGSASLSRLWRPAGPSLLPALEPSISCSESKSGTRLVPGLLWAMEKADAATSLPSCVHPPLSGVPPGRSAQGCVLAPWRPPNPGSLWCLARGTGLAVSHRAPGLGSRHSGNTREEIRCFPPRTGQG